MNSTLLLLKGKISDVNLIELKGRLDRMESVGHYNLDLTPVLSTLKSPGIGLVLGFLFGWLGVDRFYKGDGGAGVLKFVLAVGMARASKTNPDEAAIALAALLLWWLADIFLVYFGIKKDNFKKISAFFLG